MTPPQAPQGRARWLVALAAAAAIAALVIFLVFRFPGALTGRGERASLVYGLLLLVLVGGSLLLRWHGRPMFAVRHALIWLGIALLLLIGYSFRADLALNPHIDRVFGELVPFSAQVGADGALSVRAARDGHYYIEARIDDRPVRFLVDTGASDVILRPWDARELGYDLARLSFTRPFETAGGPVRGAAVRLGRFTIGGLEFPEVNTWVSSEPMGHSLLGMSFLARLEAYEFRDDTLTLRP